ncbi:MAG: glycosyltransferase family 4 protein [Polyangiaceae bacterium]|nr:glycosyltransferase family 4 protein [Polyangiaceae bacterium]
MSDAIVFVAFQSGAQANGGLESLTHILRALPSRRIVVTQRESRFTKLWRELGCEVELIDVPEPRYVGGLALARYRLARFPQLAAANSTVARLVRQSGARVVHCNDSVAMWYACIGARLAGARVLFNIRDTLGVRGPRWRALRQLSSVVVVLSDEMKHAVETELRDMVPLADTAPVERIYSAVDLGKMSPPSEEERRAVRARLGLDRESFTVVYTGTFNDKKNQLGFIEEAVPDLVRSGVAVVFVGDYQPESEPYARRCEDAIERLGLKGRVKLVGFTSTPEDWYRAADVVCLASRSEGLARAMIESLGCGTPVVSFDVSSAREILVEGECGLVEKQGDYAGLVAAIQSLQNDAALRQRYGENGARLARRLFEPAASVAAYAETYRRLGASLTTS